MALISLHKINKINKNSHIHKETDCTYNIFFNGEDKIIQFDTYGSSERKTTPKLSQTIQLNKETAAFIIELLKNEFNLQ